MRSRPLQGTDGGPVAVGFAYECDGLVFPLHLPPIGNAEISALSPDTRRWLKTQRILDELLRDTELPIELNPFQREWLFQAVLLAALIRAESDDMALPE